MNDRHAQAGTPNPELKTSPTFDGYEEASLDLQLEVDASYFNNMSCPIGQYMLSGSKLLHCEMGRLEARRRAVAPISRNAASAQDSCLLEGFDVSDLTTLGGSLKQSVLAHKSALSTETFRLPNWSNAGVPKNRD